MKVGSKQFKLMWMCDVGARQPLTGMKSMTQFLEERIVENEPAKIILKSLKINLRAFFDLKIRYEGIDLKKIKKEAWYPRVLIFSGHIVAMEEMYEKLVKFIGDGTKIKKGAACRILKEMRSRIEKLHDETTKFEEQGEYISYKLILENRDELVKKRTEKFNKMKEEADEKVDELYPRLKDKQV